MTLFSVNSGVELTCTHRARSWSWVAASSSLPFSLCCSVLGSCTGSGGCGWVGAAGEWGEGWDWGGSRGKIAAGNVLTRHAKKPGGLAVFFGQPRAHPHSHPPPRHPPARANGPVFSLAISQVASACNRTVGRGNAGNLQVQFLRAVCGGGAGAAGAPNTTWALLQLDVPGPGPGPGPPTTYLYPMCPRARGPGVAAGPPSSEKGACLQRCDGWAV